MSENDIIEWSRKYRPTSFNEMVGQTNAKRILKQWVKRNEIPHVVLAVGPSGCGKTTSLRILSSHLGCDSESYQCVEINAASSNGIDMIRQIEEQSQNPNFSSKNKNRVWIIDEFGQTTKAAQSAGLKVFEEAKSHAYFFLATTDPEKIIPTIKNRCSQIQLSEVKENDLISLGEYVLEQENIELSETILQRLASISDGSPRQFLQRLQQLVLLPDEESRLEWCHKSDSLEAGIADLAKILVGVVQGKRWLYVAKIIRSIEESMDSEAARRALLGYCSSGLMTGWGGKVDIEKCASVMKILSERTTFNSGKFDFQVLVFNAFKLNNSF
jgi:DNA polymerase III delta prime subunit